MAETVTIDRPSVAKPVSRRRSAKHVTVSESVASDCNLSMLTLWVLCQAG